MTYKSSNYDVKLNMLDIHMYNGYLIINKKDTITMLPSLKFYQTSTGITKSKGSLYLQNKYLQTFFLHLFQEEHEYHVRVFARNEVGTSDPLETEDPVKVIRPAGKYMFLGHILLINYNHSGISIYIHLACSLTYLHFIFTSDSHQNCFCDHYFSLHFSYPFFPYA